MSEKICKFCGKPLINHRNIYCSRECASKARSKRIKTTCNVCGKEFKIKNSDFKGHGKHSCSVECANIKRSNAIEIKCDQCGKIIKRTIYRLNKNKNNFCSMKCEATFRHQESIEKRKCEICGNEFEVSKKSKQRFCSTNCQKEWQKTNIGTKNKKFKQVLKKCKICGKLFYVKYNKKDNENLFCSVDCRRKWYSTVFSQSEEWKDECRKRNATLNEGVIDVNSEPQLILNKILDDLHIEYMREYSIKYYLIDSYLPKYNLMIEVQGDYWHSHPLKTKERNKYQEKGYAKDVRKHSYCLNNYNIEILYLWEDDLRKRPELCKSLIKEYVQNNGNLLNYHSFNYKYENNKLSLATNPINFYQNQNAIN